MSPKDTILLHPNTRNVREELKMNVHLLILTQEQITSSMDVNIAALIISFVVSGSLSPILIQIIAMNGGAEHSTMLILLPSCIGMSLSIMTNLNAVGKGDINWKLILGLTAIDLVSARITVQGMIDAGSTIYTVAHCSITLFTALFAVLIMKKHLQLAQWCGIGIVTLGLCILGVGCHDESPLVVRGIFLILLGSMIHSFGYVMVEHVLVHLDDPIAPELLCAILGGFGGSINIAWQLLYTLPRYKELVVREVLRHDGDIETLVIAYFALTVAACINATCFYNLVHRIGSATTGVMKGLQAVATFISSHYAFCAIQEEQCFTPAKGVSLGIVLLGVMIYTLTGKKHAVSEEDWEGDQSRQIELVRDLQGHGLSSPVNEMTPLTRVQGRVWLGVDGGGDKCGHEYGQEYEYGSATGAAAGRGDVDGSRERRESAPRIPFELADAEQLL